MKLASFLLLGIGVSLAAACPLAAAPPLAAAVMVAPDARAPVTDAQVDRWTKLWQKRLDLGEWQVSTRIVRKWELKPETLGNLRWNSENKSAAIRVLNPSDYDLPSSEIAQDIEFTILHELIHLQLAALPRDPNGKNTEERVVNRLSEALFQLEKGETYRPRSVTARNGPKSKSPLEASRSAP